MIKLDEIDDISTITIDKPKVNPLDTAMVLDLWYKFNSAESNKNIKSIIIKGNGSFFSFGLDIPYLLKRNRDEVESTVKALLKLCQDIYSSSKITISSINGHATGAGCMIAISTDYRFMVEEKAKIALNEINIGLPLFLSTTNMLKCLVGENNAKKILLGGEMMDSMTATKLGLVDKVVKRELLDETVIDFAKSFSTKKSEVIKSMKDNLKSKSVIGDVDKDEHINNFLDIFYSEETQSILNGITIRGN